MHVNIQHRINAATGSEDLYYRLKESYRDVRGVVHSLIVLNIGFEPSFQANQIRKIASALSVRMNQRGQKVLFDTWADNLNEAERYIDLDTVEHTDAREVGPEWLCKQTIDKLGLAGFLQRQGWSERDVQTALSSLIVRTVYSPSELASHRIMTDNSAACELCSGDPDWHPGINAL